MSAGEAAALASAALDWQALLSQALTLDLPADCAVVERPALSDTARQASVLLAVVEADEPYLWLTQRSDALRHHPGQISFPGGRIELSDATPWDAALREAQEEIGLASSQVRYLGGLPGYATVTGFQINPFVGWVSGSAPVQADEREVARLFSVPLSYVMDIDNYSAHTIHRAGRAYTVYAVDFGPNHIWGATAGILLSLVQRVASARGMPFALPTPAAG